MRICQISAELTPFAKTGGLGDVAAALGRRVLSALKSTPAPLTESLARVASVQVHHEAVEIPAVVGADPNRDGGFANPLSGLWILDPGPATLRLMRASLARDGRRRFDHGVRVQPRWLGIAGKVWDGKPENKQKVLDVHGRTGTVAIHPTSCRGPAFGDS